MERKIIFSDEAVMRSKESAERQRRLGFLKTEEDWVRYEYMTKIGSPVPLMELNKTWEEVIGFEYQNDVDY